MQKRVFQAQLSDEICIITEKIKTAKKQGIQCLGLTSPTPRHQQSHVTKQLTTSLSLSSKVLLVTTSLTNTRDFFKLQQKEGLHELLSTLSTSTNSSPLCYDTLAPFIYPYENFYILPAGSNPNLNDLYELENLKELFNSLKLNFDYILVDLPTLTDFNYLQPVTELLDTCILIIQSGITNLKELPLIKKKLSAFYCPMMSCILSGISLQEICPPF